MPKSKGRAQRTTTRAKGPTPRKGPVTVQQRALSSPSARYTPPIPSSAKVSPRWLGPLILGFLIAGTIVIVANYLALLPGDTSNWYLFGGLGLITVGFVLATNLR